MALTLAESQAVNEIAKLLYNFLPGSPNPYADTHISFPGIAQELGLERFWRGGSKLPALTTLLTLTLDQERSRFCKLIVEIVHRGMIYRNGKNIPVNREEIDELNKYIERVRFKIPDLREQDFLDRLPRSTKTEEPIKGSNNIDREKFLRLLEELETMNPQARGFAFEKFLSELFSLSGLTPRNSFRLTGEQIDGSLQLDGDTYLVEAKWQKEPIGNTDLLAFRGKVEGKATWARGLIVSYGGFSEDGLTAFARGRATNVIAMNGQDLYFMLRGTMSLPDILRLKVRRAAETGQIWASVYELILYT